MVTYLPCVADDDRVFKALADPTRRFLLDRLFARDGRTLTDLESDLEMTRFGVMKHLRVLEDAGFRDDKIGVAMRDRTQQEEVRARTGQKVVCVFVPATPNPTSGFLLMVPEEKAIRLDMSVPDAIKYVISLFLTDFLIRVLVNPRYSPTLVLGRLIVRNQVPE